MWCSTFLPGLIPRGLYVCASKSNASFQVRFRAVRYGLYAGTSGGSFSSSPFYKFNTTLVNNLGADFATVADLNGDGNPDLVLGTHLSSASNYAGFAAILFGSGKGAFTVQPASDQMPLYGLSYPNVLVYTSVTAAHLNSKGTQPDLLFQHNPLDLSEPYGVAGAFGVLNQNNPQP